MATYQDEFNNAIAEIDPWVRSQREEQAEEQRLEAIFSAVKDTPLQRWRRRFKALSQTRWVKWTFVTVTSAVVAAVVEAIFR